MRSGRRGTPRRAMPDLIDFYIKRTHDLRVEWYREITLWTQSMLLAARGIYQATGFRRVNEEPHHSFGVDLVGETWEMEL